MLHYIFSSKELLIQVSKYLNKRCFIIFWAFFLQFFSASATENEVKDNFANLRQNASTDEQNYSFEDQNLFLHGDFNYHANIGTVLFTSPDFEMGQPVIHMNSGEKLLLKFDDLDADYKSYSYTILHCDAYWEPAQLMDFEYIDGFSQDQITNYSFSINTIVPYTQYTLEFPNENMKPMLSGNYLMIVFLDGDPENVVFTRRFMVLEPLLPIEGDVHIANLVSYRDFTQQLNFSIDMSRYNISNPYQDLKIVIRQNGRWDNAITNIKPRMIRGNQLIYDHEDQLLFAAGNEFRRFDIRSLRQVTQEIEDITTGVGYWNVFLLPDQQRAYRQYTTEGDINGRFYIQTTDAYNSDLEADYSWVNFRLESREPFENASVHIMGQLTQWNIIPDNALTYNPRLRQYEGRLLLKQGYYNYWYVLQEEGSVQGDVCPLEGCYSQTENDYYIYVYHRPPGSLSDKLVGILTLSSALTLRW